MNKTEIKKKKELLKENRSYILGILAYFIAIAFMIWIGSAGFYW